MKRVAALFSSVAWLVLSVVVVAPGCGGAEFTSDVTGNDSGSGVACGAVRCAPGSLCCPGPDAFCTPTCTPGAVCPTYGRTCMVPADAAPPPDGSTDASVDGGPCPGQSVCPSCPGSAPICGPVCPAIACLIDASTIDARVDAPADAPFDAAYAACFGPDGGPTHSIKTCTADSDCTYIRHTTTCCGSIEYIGIAKIDLQAAMVCEAAWDAHFPPCFCPANSSSVTTEDGKSDVDGATPRVQCSSNLCETSL